MRHWIIAAAVVSLTTSAACRNGDTPPPDATAPATASAPHGAGASSVTSEPTPAAAADGSPAHTNRLVHETSPYLLQHAHNPVDWWPWGDEAFAAAKAADKPVFLSIGYSTCHWCHVMERESFENEATAKYLNEHFICIKVDREERPDVDQIYMAVTQRMTGSGGWPMSVWLTPERKPFYTGTYFPPDSRFGRPSFLDVCGKLTQVWTEQRPAIEQNADQILAQVFAEVERAAADTALNRTSLDSAAALFTRMQDKEWGGFSGPRKFPTPHNLQLLLQLYVRSNNPELLFIVENTLDHMATGGIHDHLGGGFSRYSTDRQWLVPHFEKMLYDQAMLLRTYVNAYQVTGSERHATVARDIVRYVFRDLQDAGGAFHSAEDADSEGEEGKFYVWTIAELTEHLGAERGARFGRVYGFDADGNWAEESNGHKSGTNILHLPASLAAAAEAESMELAELIAQLQADRDTLLAVRAKRIRPLLDDKILTSWNGLFIASLAYGARALDEPAWAEAAAKATDFLLATHRRDDGRVLRSSRAGTAKATLGYVDDYAFLAEACLELYTTTGEVRWLEEARTLCTAMLDLFGPGGAGGTQRGLLFFTGHDAEALITRSVEVYDGAIPSGNSIAARTLLRLGRLLFDKELENAGLAIVREASDRLNDNPPAHTAMGLALDWITGSTREIVVAGTPGEADYEALRTRLNHTYLPNSVIAWHPTGDAGAATRALLGYLAAQGPVKGAAAAYVCESYACKAPVTQPAALNALLVEPALPIPGGGK